MKQVVAIDLGASSGCLMLMTLKDGKIYEEEIHRFTNEIVERDNYLYWNIEMIYDEIITGLQKVDGEIAAIGIDTWGVDLGVIGKDGTLLDAPFSYRDTHTIPVMEAVHQKVSDKEIFQRTGVESAPINTLYRVKSIYELYPEWLDETDSILTLPSLINYLLTGEKYNEFTHASTTQMLQLNEKQWDEKLLDEIFGFIPKMAPLLETNRTLGYTKPSVTKAINQEPVPIIQVPGHDTACALAAIPRINKGSAFMSCGTWVLIGVEVDEPVISEESFEWGFTNEGTAEGHYRLQKNNMGLWLLQECKREWEQLGQEISYEEEAQLIKDANPFQSFIDPDDPLFFNPASMVEAIQTFCKNTNQPVPETKGEILRCILESLAMKYRWILNRLEFLTKKEIPEVHMVGGGIQNKYLCQFIANATQKHVQTGPIEASSLGNALAQFIALGEVDNWQHAKEIVEHSYGVKDFVAENTNEWDAAYEKFKTFLSV